MFISYTQCFVLHIEHSSVRVTWLLNWKSRWGILSVGCVELEFNLERVGGKKSPVFKKPLVPVAALGNNFIPFVKCGPGVIQGDVRLLHQTEVADPHPPAVWWRKAEDGPVLIVCGLLILQLPDVTWEGRLVGILAVVEGGLVSSEPLLEGVWGESDVLLGGASGLHSAPVDKVGGLALPFRWAGLRPTVATLGLHVARWPSHLLVVPRDYPGHVGHAAVADLYSASVKVLS